MPAIATDEMNVRNRALVPGRAKGPSFQSSDTDARREAEATSVADRGSFAHRR